MARTAIVVALGCALLTSPARATNFPPGFYYENAVPSVSFDVPTGIACLPGGRMLVAEKKGLVWAISHSVRYPTPMWDGQLEVLDNGDRGLLGIAVDPRYVSNHYIYLLYTVDADSNGVDDNVGAFGRLTRYTVSFADSNTVDYSSRTILMGRTWAEGPCSGSPSHTIGSLRFASDGSLLVSAGEGAQFNQADSGGLDPELFGPGETNPYEDIGAFRAQSVSSLAGKILRINPGTGYGYVGNPYYDGDVRHNRSRVWCYGLRNPFRFCIRPGTGSADTTAANPGAVYIGDVGWDTFEEMNVAPHGGMNFGWPCYESSAPNYSYQPATPAHNGCGSEGSPDNPTTHTDPVAFWHHSVPAYSSPPTFSGNASIGGVFYTDTLYPATYRGRYFFGDYGQHWIKTAVMDASNQLVQIQDFATEALGPVDFAIEPATGNIVYVSLTSNQVRRIRYSGSNSGNNPPIAVATGAPTVGVAPLTVNFSSAGTYDPDGDPMTLDWTFGDGQGSTSPNPSHSYPAPGTFDALLTVNDNHGGEGNAVVRVIVAATASFPTTPVVDNFNRSNGPIGGSWVDDDGALTVADSTATMILSSASTVWNGGVFGPDQEAYFTVKAMAPNAPEHDVMLKVQGLSWTTGHIEVRYDATVSNVQISTFTPGADWNTVGIIPYVTLQPGDRFGARAYSNGAVEAYQNGVLLGSASVTGWPFAALGGHIGMTLWGAAGSRVDDFGGGDAVLDPNTPPHATILAPAESSFFATGDTIRLVGAASDAQDPLSALSFLWEVDVRHNNHVHPNVMTASTQNAYYIGINHDDGTGVYDHIRFIVTDTGGKRDTATADLFPDIDISPSAITTVPNNIGTLSPASYIFNIRNSGKMPAPYSHWQLVAGSVTLAEGDTLVAARDSVTISRTLAPVLAPGTYTLRVKVDTLGKVVETNEANNATTRPIKVVAGTTDVGDGPPRSLALSAAYPNPSRGGTFWALELPRAARVEMSVLDLQGRKLWSAPSRELDAGRWSLAWTGQSRDGRRAGPGLYLARVSVDGESFTRRFVLLH